MRIYSLGCENNLFNLIAKIRKIQNFFFNYAEKVTNF